MRRRNRASALCLFGLLAATACGGGDPPPAVDRQAMIDEARLAFGAPGAVAVLRAGGDQWNGVSGSADLDGTRLTDETRFRVGSVTKPVVAALVLEAVSRGDLSLEDTVGDLLPDVALTDPSVTVRMLLDHTSGIFNAGDEGDVIADIDKLTDPAMRAEAMDVAKGYLAGEQVLVRDRVFVALAETHDRYFEAGTGYHYSNVNYQLAAMVLERVTGESLPDLLRSQITEPLGLQRTTLAPYDTSSPEMRGYVIDAADGSMKDMTDDFLALGNGGGGGVISTADELLTTVQAIVSGRLVDEALLTDMKTATPQSDESYGLGLTKYYLSCGTFYGHGGAIDGTLSIAVVTPDGADGVAIAVNLRHDVDPDLLPFAETFLCDGR